MCVCVCIVFLSLSFFFLFSFYHHKLPKLSPTCVVRIPHAFMRFFCAPNSISCVVKCGLSVFLSVGREDGELRLTSCLCLSCFSFSTQISPFEKPTWLVENHYYYTSAAVFHKYQSFLQFPVNYRDAQPSAVESFILLEAAPLLLFFLICIFLLGFILSPSSFS